MKNNKTLLQFNYEQTVATEKYFLLLEKHFDPSTLQPNLE